MWARASRALRRGLLLLPLALTLLALFTLPRPPRLSPSASFRHTHTTPAPEHDESQLSNDVPELQELKHRDRANGRPWFMKGGYVRPIVDPNKPLKLFPEDAIGEDRIVDQLMYTLEAELPLKKILLANGLNSWGASSGRTEFLRNKCPVDSCVLSSDSRDAATADAILFKDHHMPFGVKRPPHQIWILYYLECPYHTSSMRSTTLDVFNWTATYRRDSDIVAPYERWVYYDNNRTERDLDRNYAANKTKKVAWFVSNCHARNRRLQYARQLAKHIQVDIYGACGSHHCPRSDPNCLEMLDRDYKFYLAFENSNCKDYITEKFFINGLSHDVLPIVMGARASDYAAVAPHNSYIHVEEFANAEELAAYLRRIDEDDALYNSYFKWKGTGEFVNTFFFCRLCAMLHASAQRPRTAHYTDVQGWWRDGACTRGEWRAVQPPAPPAPPAGVIAAQNLRERDDSDDALLLPN